jgi:hypothetical protein
MILLRPICWAIGHRRGTLVRTTDDLRYYACRRCGRLTRYKVKPNGQSAGEPTDGSPSISVAQANAEYLAKRKP